MQGGSASAARGPSQDLDRASAAAGEHMKALADLAERWRDEATVLRRCGHERTAALNERHAGQVEAVWREHQLQPLTVREAAAESGYSESHLYHALVEGGALRNCGQPRAPRIRRRDLPRKPRGPEGLIPLERAAILADLE